MHQRRYRLRAVLALITAASLWGCSWPYTVWIVPGSTAMNLIFGLATDSSRATSLPIEFVTVSEKACDFRSRFPDERVWQIDRSSPEPAPAISRLKFGAPPVGYREEVSVEALHAGCYEISVQASGGHHGRTTLRINPSGEVAEIPWHTLDSAYSVNLRSNQRQDSIAATQCSVGYRAARNARDTAGVDRMVWYDATRFSPRLTCQFNCTKVGPHTESEASRRSQCASTRYDMYGRPI